MADDRGLRAVAAFEAAKGAVVLLTGFGLLALAHRDLHALGQAIVERLHLNPARGTALVFLDAIAAIDDARLRLLALGAAAYSVLRFVEAWGLWHVRRWAQWLGALSGGVYLPIELYAIVKGVTALNVGAFALNLAIVAYLARTLARRTIARRSGAPTT